MWRDLPASAGSEMKRAALIPLLIFLTSCASGGGGTGTIARPGQGAITIQIVPNPIVATKVSGNTYDFPFEVVVRETGGRPVEITRVSADVFALGGIPVADESYDAERIRALGYATSLPANGELRYRFAPRKEVPDDRLFGGVTARLRADGRDDTGTPVSASTEVTV